MVSDLRQRTAAPRWAESHPRVLSATFGVAAAVAPLVDLVFDGAAPVRFEFWDGSALGPDRGPGRVQLRSPAALRRILWSPDELGLGRAYVAGEIAIDGDAVELLRALRLSPPTGLVRQARIIGRALRVGAAVGALGLPPARPREEFRPQGRVHSIRRDARAISHHYDVGNAFYRLVLGPTMTYSCARWGAEVAEIDAAQDAKHDLVSRKLGLHHRPAARLLDVGCGWGSMALHAASHYGASVVGVTISEQQAAAARQRVEDAGMTDRVEIRLQDYRELHGERFDAISSIGMFEHVGLERTAEYFATLHSLLQPTGRLLNHAISKPGGGAIARRSFMSRYVFPDGALMDVADTIRAMESAGFEVRDVESLREHYALTLRAWVRALETNWDSAVREVGEARARIWRAYMAASVVGFEEGDLAVHQVLGVVPEAGTSAMSLRRDW